MVSQYAVVCCGGNTELAALELRRQLRDHVVFERCAPRHARPVCGKPHNPIFHPRAMHWDSI